MDQTPFFITSHSMQTLDMRGVKTVNIDTLTQDTSWVTLVVTVCADGIKLSLMVIFKGKQNGKIATMKFPTFPAVSTSISRMHG